MNENELKSLEVYNEKFKEDPTSFNDFQANDYIKLLKKTTMKRQLRLERHLCHYVQIFADI